MKHFIAAVVLMFFAAFTLSAGEADFKKLIRKEADRLFQEGEYSQAVDAYEAILKKDPNDLDALMSTGECHEKLRNDELAVEKFKKAYKLLNRLADPSLSEKILKKKVVEKLENLDRDFARLNKLNREEHQKHVDRAQKHLEDKDIFHALEEYRLATLLLFDPEVEKKYLHLSREYFGFLAETDKSVFKAVNPGRPSKKVIEQMKKGGIIQKTSNWTEIIAWKSKCMAALKIPDQKGPAKIDVHARCQRGTLLLMLITKNEAWFVVEVKPDQNKITSWRRTKDKKIIQHQAMPLETLKRWTHFEIRFDKKRVTCRANGDLLIDKSFPDAASGFDFKTLVTRHERPASVFHISDIRIKKIKPEKDTTESKK